MGAEARFRAMGSDVHVVVLGPGADALVEQGRAAIVRLERLWSRFLPTSEVSLLNTLAGMPVHVGPETALLLERSLDGWRRTGGRFDPTVLGDVVRAGYDRSYELLDPDEPSHDDRRRGAAGIEVQPSAGLARLPEGVGFDPGGIGKGLAADLVTAELLAAGASGACVNVGGDLRVRGEGPLDGDWHVALADPFDRPDVAVVSLREGSVATSTRVHRVLPGGHHLIDPSTGEPSEGGLASVSAVASAGWLAEVLAKAAFMAGPDEGPSVLEDLGADGLLVRNDGAVLRTGGFGRFEPVGVAS